MGTELHIIKQIDLDSPGVPYNVIQINQWSFTPSDSNLNRNLKALTVWEPRYPNKVSSKDSQQSLRVKLAFFNSISLHMNLEWGTQALSNNVARDARGVFRVIRASGASLERFASGGFVRLALLTHRSRKGLCRRQNRWTKTVQSLSSSQLASKEVS